MTSEEHKKVIDQQKALADEAGILIAKQLVSAIPVRILVNSTLPNFSKLEVAKKIAQSLVLKYIVLIDKPMNETSKIGSDFAQEKLKASL